MKKLYKHNIFKLLRNNEKILKLKEKKIQKYAQKVRMKNFTETSYETLCK